MLRDLIEAIFGVKDKDELDRLERESRLASLERQLEAQRTLDRLRAAQ